MEEKAPNLEEEILAFWKKRKIFEKSLEKTKDDKPFTFYDGPPFATGLPHYGHILASTIKDVVPRYQTMRGRLVRRRWGWDCHGLPIEEIVERKLGISGKKQIEKVGIKTFNETCRSMVLQYVSEWRSMVNRIARWVDFDNSYKTMDTDYMESVWWAFKKIYDKDLVYEGRKVLLYCPRCETPVSNFEVAMDNSYRDVTEEAVTVKFKLKTGQKIGKDFYTDDSTYILAWTTTPWTLPGNVALAVGKDIEYSALRVRDGKDLYLVASNLVPKIFKDKEIEFVHRGILGSDLMGLAYEPLFNVPAMESDKAFKIYTADFVSTEEGTGVVHTAVVYGEDDYALGVKEGLPIVPLLDEKGVFNADAPEFIRGMYFKDSEKFIKKDLEERPGGSLLFERKMHQHSYPYCWRCGNVLFYNAIPAWFVNIQKIKAKLLKSNDREINWFPEHLKHGRYEKSVEAAPDWNISRNRYWGNPIPVWKCEACDRVEAVGSIEELAKHTGPAKNNYWAMRHGESENVIFKIVDSGDQNSHLTPVGKKEVAAAAKKLASKKIDLIFSSDLTRTKESAEIVAEELGLAVHFDKRLHEIDLGSLSGKPVSEYWDTFPTPESRFTGKPSDKSESLRDVRTRAWEFLREMEEKHHDKNILIVSHEDTIWMMSEAASGWSEKVAASKKISNEKEFMKPAEILSIDLKTIPRDDTGLVDLHRPYIDDITFPCNSCKTGKMVRTPEIFDSWMEAGSMPFAEYHYPFENKDIFESRFPAQFVAEYIAQTRAWFYVMHVISFILFDKAPFENVVTTGTILAEDGSKMSKSKANFPDPTILINKYGADSLRFYLMNSVVMQADNLNFSEKAVENIYRKVVLLLLNVHNYFETYVEENHPSNDAPDAAHASKNILDVWIDLRTQELLKEVTEYIDAYDTVHATRAIQEYVDDLSTWYLRRSRKRKDAAFFKTMSSDLLLVSKVIAPFMPFLADELYRKLKHYESDQAPESVHLTDWPKAHFSLGEKERDTLTAAMAEVRRLASLGLAARAMASVKVRQPLASLKIKEQKVALGKEFTDILADEVNVKNIIVDPTIAGEVELDLVLTEALRTEGLLRALGRMVQELRQKAELAPKDKIVIMLELPAAMEKVIVLNEADFRADLGAKLVEYGEPKKFDAEQSAKIEGEDVRVAMRKA